MRTKRLTIKTVVLALGFSMIPLTTSLQSAWACSAAPGAPIVKTIWGTTGGPSFTVTPAKTDELPTTIYYAYAVKKVSKDSWEPWAAWVPTQVTSAGESATFTAPMAEGNDLITFSAYAYNVCGSSGQNQIYRKLVTNDSLMIPNLTIAEDLPLSVGTIPTYFFSPMAYELPQTLTSKNPAICAFDESAKVLKLISAGECEITISQNNELLATPNPDVTQTINILPTPKILPVTGKDRPDEIDGFQIHVVYVKVNGTTPHEYYEKGDVNNWLDLANAWMKRKLGKEFKFDTFEGTYDISTMFSQYTAGQLEKDGAKSSESSSNTQPTLFKLQSEFSKQNGLELIGKNLLFIIDANLSEKYCGFANQPGISALITPVSSGCWSPEFGYLAQTLKLNYPSKSLIHELVHNLGVGHPCEDLSDLMIGGTCAMSKEQTEITLDSAKKLYIGTSKAGANILDFKVWKDGSGSKYPTSRGLCYVNTPCLVSDWFWRTPQGDLQIQEKIAGKWKTLQTFKIKKIATNKYAFNASIIPTSKGIHTYREYIPGTKKYGAYTGRQITKTVPY
ncbi:unannotated protein [freshwater metagenome]|uniref:Unannotated protein n=1 Tax=freshwater metagenome TaxID=449393 RepID=A0A6J6UBI0_9ZZZZ|nr:hypothetical protein [Actinomycetota bacterium]